MIERLHRNYEEGRQVSETYGMDERVELACCNFLL